jgi:hypothetical protein
MLVDHKAQDTRQSTTTRSPLGGLPVYSSTPNQYQHRRCRFELQPRRLWPRWPSFLYFVSLLPFSYDGRLITYTRSPLMRAPTSPYSRYFLIPGDFCFVLLCSIAFYCALNIKRPVLQLQGQSFDHFRLGTLPFDARDYDRFRNGLHSSQLRKVCVDLFLVLE